MPLSPEQIEEIKNEAKVEKQRLEKEAEVQRQIKDMVQQARKWIAEFLGRNSIISGRNRGKGFHGGEIIEGLKITDFIKQEAIVLALIELEKNPENPEKVKLVEADCGKGQEKISYFYIKK